MHTNCKLLLVLLLSELEVSLLCALESDLWFFCLLWFLLVLALMACVACQLWETLLDKRRWDWCVGDDGVFDPKWNQDHSRCALHA